MTHYTFTRINNPAPVAKVYRLSADGERAEKDAELSRTRLASCTDAQAERLSMSIDEAAAAFDELTARQAIVYGVSKNGAAACRLVSKRVAAREGVPHDGTSDIALRTRACFEYPRTPAFFMIDHDPKGEETVAFRPSNAHTLCGKSLDSAALRNLFAELMPEASAAPMISRPSGSTWMRRASDGKQLRGAGGERLLVGVADGTYIPALAAELFERLAAKGLAHIELSTSGALLARTPFDFAVYQPERFDFIGGAEVCEGLERNPPASQVTNADKGPFDVAATLGDQLRDTNPDERLAAGSQRLRDARRAFVRRMRAENPEIGRAASTIRYEWLRAREAAALNRAQEIKGTALTAAERRAIEIEHARIAEYMAADSAPFLLGSFVLPGDVTVAQVLNDPARYLGREFADPIEPDYDGGRPVAAVLIGDDGQPYIFSQAHGGYSLRLCRTLWDVPAPSIEQCVTVTAAGLTSPALATTTTVVGVRTTGQACELTFDDHGVFPSEAAAGFTIPPASDDDAPDVERPPRHVILAHPTWFCSPADTAERPEPRRLAPAVYEFKPTYITNEDGAKTFAGWRAVRLCSAVVTFAEARATGEREHILLVRDTAREWHVARVAAAEFARGGRLEAALRTAGLHDYTSNTWLRVHDMLGAQQKRAVKADMITAIGWANERYTRFNTPHVGIQIAEDDTPNRLSVPAVPTNIAEAFTNKGTLTAWQHAAAQARGDWVFTCALAAAFAPVLLRPLGKSGAGLHLWGPSGVGKSTPLKLAKSVWGRPDLASWDTTLNGAVAAAAVAQDALTVYDEIGAASDPRVPPKLAYALVNGSERSRANQDGSARAPRQFRTVVLSSGEHSMAEAAAKTGAAHDEGQEVRFLDVAVPADASRSSEFLRRGARPFSMAVGAAIADNYGHAGTCFVERLLTHAVRYGGVPQVVREAFASVDATLYRPDNVAENVLRARETFVLFATAGELATLLGVLGPHWQRGDATEACGRAYAAWLSARAERGDLSESGETQRAALALRDMTEATSAHWTQPNLPLSKDSIGWREAHPSGTAYYVQDGALKQVLTTFSPARLSLLLSEKRMALSGRNTIATDGQPAKPFTARLGGSVVKVRGFLIPHDDSAIQPLATLAQPLDTAAESRASLAH